MTVQEILKSNASKITEKHYVAPDIPEKKLNNAISKIAPDVSPTNVVLILDNTVFGSLKEGILFSGTKMSIKSAFSDRIEINYDELTGCDYYVKNIEKEKSNGEKKITTKPCIRILTENRKIEIDNLLHCNYERLAEMLNEIMEVADTSEEVSQIITLAEMNENIKIPYMKIIINMAFSDDDIVDSKEYAEIISLITRLDFTPEQRIVLRAYIGSPEILEDTQTLINQIDENCPPGNDQALHISLMKDIVNLYKVTKEDKAENCQFLMEIKQPLGITDDEITFVEKAIDNDLDILKNPKSDKQVERTLKDLAAKAGAIGVPLAAIYMSGSVIGISAAGLTSGLAAMGLGGVLGFSSMFTGIGVAVLLGVGTYQGLKVLTGSKEVESQKRRELLLNEVIKNTQKTINVLIEDINYISKRLVQEINIGREHSLQIKKLSLALSMLSKAGHVLNEKLDSTEKEVHEIKCPKVLNEDKLKNLTSDPTKKPLYTEVMTCYAEETAEDGKKVLSLRRDLTAQKAEQLGNIFESIGYFSAGSILKGTFKNIFNG